MKFKLNFLIIFFLFCIKCISQQDSVSYTFLLKDAVTNLYLNSFSFEISSAKSYVSLKSIKDSSVTINLLKNERYIIQINKTGYNYFQENFVAISDYNLFNQNKVLYLKPVKNTISLLPVFLFKNNSLSFIDKKQANTNIEWLLNYLNENPNYSLELIGYADINEKHQKRLTHRRVSIVKRSLVKKGVPPKKLTIIKSDKYYVPYKLLRDDFGYKKGDILDEETIEKSSIANKDELRKYNRRVSIVMRIR